MTQYSTQLHIVQKARTLCIAMAALYTTTHLSGEPNRPLALEPGVFGGTIKFFLESSVCAVKYGLASIYVKLVNMRMRGYIHLHTRRPI